MKSKPISRNFGFWVLLLSALANAIQGHDIVASIFLVGAVLFDGIKSINKSEIEDEHKRNGD